MASYRDALQALGHEVRCLSIHEAASQSRSPWLKLSWMPALNRLGAEQLVIEGNRLLILETIGWRCELLLTTGYDVLPGTLATLNSAIGCKLVLIYPDPLVNLQGVIVQSLPLYDAVVYCCGSFGLPYFQRLGAHHVYYLPFAWDDRLHPRLSAAEEQSITPRFDVVFIGAWRLDREAWLENLRDFKVGVWGSVYWRKRTRPGSVARRSWQGVLPRDKSMCEHVDQAKLC